METYHRIPGSQDQDPRIPGSDHRFPEAHDHRITGSGSEDHRIPGLQVANTRARLTRFFCFSTISQADIDPLANITSQANARADHAVGHVGDRGWVDILWLALSFMVSPHST